MRPCVDCRFVTHAENGQNKSTTKLNWDTVTEIRNARLLIPGITQQELADAYDVSKRHINNILNDKSWIENKNINQN